jgi:hypothetical protein
MTVDPCIDVVDETCVNQVHVLEKEVSDEQHDTGLGVSGLIVLHAVDRRLQIGMYSLWDRGIFYYLNEVMCPRSRSGDDDSISVGSGGGDGDGDDGDDGDADDGDDGDDGR